MGREGRLVGREGETSAPFPLTQIVPNSASIYGVFHSVNYNSVHIALSPTSQAGLRGPHRGANISQVT